jgi:hypothetical protein
MNQKKKRRRERKKERERKERQKQAKRENARKQNRLNNQQTGEDVELGFQHCRHVPGLDAEARVSVELRGRAPGSEKKAERRNEKAIQ